MTSTKLADKFEKLFDVFYLKEAAPRKPIKPGKTVNQPPTENSDKIEQQAQPVVNALNKSEGEEFDLSDFENSGLEDAVVLYNDTALPTFSYKLLAFHLNVAYDTKQPLLVYGDPGIGKSEVVKGTAQQIGSSVGREYINWSDISAEQQLNVINNPSKYFVLVDIRVNKLEPSDFVGIPDIADKQAWLETKQNKWIYLLSLPEAAGILFLDEINQGSPAILRALYEVVNDRSIGGTPMSKDFLVVGAGNLGAEFEDPIPQALTNRFTAGVLIADPETWLEWAEQNHIDKHIIAFVRVKPADNFFAKPKNSDDPFPTPRQMTKLSKKMKHLYKYYGEQAKQGKNIEVSIYKAIGTEAAGLCGGHWARGFVTFLKHIRAFDMKNIIKNVKTINKESKDKLHALVVFVVNKLKVATSNMIKNPGAQPAPNDVEILEGIAKITNNLDKEWKTVLWSNIRRELPQPNLERTLTFLVKGNYDAATKQELLQKSLPILKKILAT